MRTQHIKFKVKSPIIKPQRIIEQYKFEHIARYIKTMSIACFNVGWHSFFNQSLLSKDKTKEAQSKSGII